MTGMGSGADLDDLALEQFQRFLNQRIVFEIVFAERNWHQLFPGWLGGTRASFGRRREFE